MKDRRLLIIFGIVLVDMLSFSLVLPLLPYFAKNFGWARSQITLGFPIAAILTLWVGPLLVPKLSPRKSIVIGTGLTCLALSAASFAGGTVYYLRRREP